MPESVERLMQPGGNDHWTDMASCQGDKRFTQEEEPDKLLAEELGVICSRCEVFTECFNYHNYPDVIGVWAAGEWKEDSNVCSQ